MFGDNNNYCQNISIWTHLCDNAFEKYTGGMYEYRYITIKNKYKKAILLTYKQIRNKTNKQNKKTKNHKLKYTKWQKSDSGF